MVVKKGVKKLFSHKFEEKKPNEDEARWGNVQGDR